MSILGPGSPTGTPPEPLKKLHILMVFDTADEAAPRISLTLPTTRSALMAPGREIAPDAASGPPDLIHRPVPRPVVCHEEPTA